MKTHSTLHHTIYATTRIACLAAASSLLAACASMEAHKVRGVELKQRKK